MAAAAVLVGMFTLGAAAARAAELGELPPGASLSKEEIAEGWILLFDGHSTFGWKIDGPATVEGGMLVLGGDEPTTAETTSPFDWASANLMAEAMWEGDQPPTATLGAIGPAELGDDNRGRFTTHTAASPAKDMAQQSVAPLKLQVPAGAKLYLRALKLQPQGLEPIINGRDLTGWNAIPDMKSEFAVVPGEDGESGELSIKNGPGDLQTEAAWADFILQLDIKTLGEHLNSGVFFRTLPGKSWSGYEAQIRNQWEGDDRTKPVDFGTGGIYRRQPARRVAASDNAWFTMTVSAVGPHLAVWVNGYQVSDFTDTRPANESARQGLKVDAGPISLQGHDPTTDLRFRRIRIGELGE